MFEINHRTRMGVKLKDNYFAPGIQEEKDGYDVVYYFNCQTPAKDAREFTTLFIDLRKTEEELFADFKRSTKQSINKMQREPNAEFSMIESPTDEDLHEFIEHFNSFAKNKGIYECDQTLLFNLRDLGKLRIAKATHLHEILCLFAFIRDEKRVAGQYECNMRFSNLDNADKVRLIGHANKQLEFFSMKWFKERGVEIYDMSGLTFDENNEQATNIDKRKMGFGGSVVTEYHFMHPVTLKGKLFVESKKIVNKD